MELVELEGLANSIVGKPGLSGLSVEQRKRLTIAVELVANPSIIFMVRPPPSSARALGFLLRARRAESLSCTCSAGAYLHAACINRLSLAHLGMLDGSV
jgi:hypothetical protein